MKMDKALIKEVRYCPANKRLLVEFKDGSKFGEVGNIAKRTFEKLNADDVKVIELEPMKNEKVRAISG